MTWVEFVADYDRQVMISCVLLPICDVLGLVWACEINRAFGGGERHAQQCCFGLSRPCLARASSAWPRPRYEAKKMKKNGNLSA